MRVVSLGLSLLLFTLISACATPATRPQNSPLRVGTTGDYRPYSFQESEKTEFSGIDIDLAHKLGEFLGRPVVFVKTTWPTLMRDLEQGRFDIAMSGISRNPEREARASFSESYVVAGKSAIVRCADSDRFSALDKMDLPDVKVISNPGGTNEKFARAHFKSARIFVYADNKSIFDQIVEGKADVMFTDTEEVKLQTARLPALCPARPSKEYDPVGKAVLMPKNSPLKDSIDRWLDQETKSGDLKRVIDGAS